MRDPAVPLTRHDIRRALESAFENASQRGEQFVEITSGQLHRQLGGYPGQNHRMPMVGGEMLSLERDTDTIVQQPPKGKGASLTIRY